jgi:Tfp pilus assembly protein PilF
MSDMINNLQAMLDAGQDNALLRFTLGSQLFGTGDIEAALEHLRSAVAQDPGYSAAWKVLGKVLQESGDAAGARDAYRAGIATAKQKGDVQAAREMEVFLKRAEKLLAGDGQ